MFLRIFTALAVLVSACAAPLFAQAAKESTREFLPPPWDRYFARRVTELSTADWQKEITRENWPAVQAKMRGELQHMLGLDPWPARGALNPKITGTVQGDGYVIEKLHFESLPGLYVTANLYRPTTVAQPLPTVLYVCGHSRIVEDGVSMGNKTDYQHHGIWFARHGYVCMAIDTIQLGEISGFHHGTYNLNRWWWPSRGYTPAGVEAWNSMRALDYLETRPEVDKARFGITGISGGGVYSWWTAALDERIKVAVPTAGIATLKNHVLDGSVEGHCDCMFKVNTHRWDYDRVAALLAPRALLIANTDKDTIFPLDGVVEIYNRTRSLYRTLGKEEHIGLHIAEGPHGDSQPLNTGAFHWMERFLKGAKLKDVLDEPASKVHPHRELKVFAELPKDEKVTTVDEFFVPAFGAKADGPSAAEWPQLRDAWMKALREDCFRAWPAEPAQVQAKQTTSSAQGLRLTKLEFSTQETFELPMWILHREDTAPEALELIVLNVLDDQSWAASQASSAAGFPAQFPGVTADEKAFGDERKMLLGTKWGMAYVAPRGVGPSSWSQLSAGKQTQLRRRLLLLGESLESAQVWDIHQAAAALRSVPSFARTPLWLQSQKAMAANALYASLFIPDVKRLDLHAIPGSHRDSPTYLNVLRHLDLPQAVALAAERSTIALYTSNAAPWEYSQKVAAALGWGEKRVQIRQPADLPTPR